RRRSPLSANTHAFVLLAGRRHPNARGYTRACSRSPIPHSPRFAICATTPRPDRRRALELLELLAASHDGATEALMIAHGFTPPRGCEFAHLKDSLAGRSSCLSAI